MCWIKNWKWNTFHIHQWKVPLATAFSPHFAWRIQALNMTYTCNALLNQVRLFSVNPFVLPAIGCISQNERPGISVSLNLCCYCHWIHQQLVRKLQSNLWIIITIHRQKYTPQTCIWSSGIWLHFSCLMFPESSCSVLVSCKMRTVCDAAAIVKSVEGSQNSGHMTGAQPIWTLSLSEMTCDWSKSAVTG